MSSEPVDFGLNNRCLLLRSFPSLSLMSAIGCWRVVAVAVAVAVTEAVAVVRLVGCELSVVRCCRRL